MNHNRNCICKYTFLLFVENTIYSSQMDLVFCLAGIGFFLLFGTSLCLILIVLLFATDSVVKFLAKVERNLYMSRGGAQDQKFKWNFCSLPLLSLFSYIQVIYLIVVHMKLHFCSQKGTIISVFIVNICKKNDFDQWPLN